MAFQSFAAPLSYAGPTAASEPAKITGTWSTDASGSWRFNAPDGAAKGGWYYLNTTNNATDYNWFCFDANGVMRTGWVQDKNDPSVWYYTGETKDSSEGGLAKGWITDPQDGKKYYLDPSTGIMCHGWKQISGVWYYFGESRYADRKWAPDTTGYWKAGASGKHSYGSLYMNEWTPDGYYVGANGAWVQNYREDDNSDKPDPAPETKKLSEILPAGFPTSADFAWVNENGKKAYKDGDSIKVGSLTLGKDVTVTRSGDNYVCKSGDATVTFNVKDGAAESITVTGLSDSNGTYAPAAPTFKAVYDTTEDVNTLTFYYNNKEYSGDNITVYDNLPTAATQPMDWGYNGNRSKIKSVVIDSSVAGYDGLTSTAYMFMNMKSATDISGAEYLDVSNVADMSLMFQDFGGGSVGNPTTINVVPDVSNWNTGNVTNMKQMFFHYGHESETFNAVPDVSKWDTGNVTDMSHMFEEYGKNSTALNTVPNVSKWNTGNVTNMYQMFNGYGNISSNISCVLDLSGWDLSKIKEIMGADVFKFNPKTFDVTIPAKTGEKSNESDKWYYGDGTNTIAPPTGKTFTLAAPTISTIADVLATAGDNAPSATNHWNDTKGNYIYVDGGYLSVYVSLAGGTLDVTLDKTVTPNGDNYLYSGGVLSFTFNMTEGLLTSIYVNCSVYGVNDTFSPAPAVSTMLTLGVSGGQTHDAPMAGTEVSEPTAEVFEPEFEPEKFEEAKPEELIEPAEAVAEEAAP